MMFKEVHKEPNKLLIFMRKLLNKYIHRRTIESTENYRISVWNTRNRLNSFEVRGIQTRFIEIILTLLSLH